MQFPEYAVVYYAQLALPPMVRWHGLQLLRGQGTSSVPASLNGAIKIGSWIYCIVSPLHTSATLAYWDGYDYGLLHWSHDHDSPDYYKSVTFLKPVQFPIFNSYISNLYSGVFIKHVFCTETNHKSILIQLVIVWAYYAEHVGIHIKSISFQCFHFKSLPS